MSKYVCNPPGRVIIARFTPSSKFTLFFLQILFFFSQFLAHDTDFSSPLPRYEFQGVVSDVWLPIKVPKVSSESTL